jgi:hypothetical protein
VKAIAADLFAAYYYIARGNLLAAISNGAVIL